MLNTKEEFLEIYNKHIKREGAEQLLKFLENSDFFVAPASTRRHSSYEGGLCSHSILAYKRFVKLLTMEYGENYNEVISDESVAIIGLLHDLCKVNFYKVDYRNVKENGNWVQKPYYTVDDTLPYGHGEKSVYMISGFMKLTREEAMAINWHMGGFDSRFMGGNNTLQIAYENYPTALIFHTADMWTTYFDEKTDNI